VLLYLHGTGENISANVEHAKRFQQMGFSVLLIDYRGYGKSEGNFPSEAQVYQDAQAAWDYLVQQLGIKPQNIFIYGQSLGGAIAINLALQNPQTPGLIVECTFSSIRDLVAHQGIYNLFPKNLLLQSQFDSLSKVKLLKMPVLLIHGAIDTIIPTTMSQVLHDTITAPKRLWIVPGAHHNNIATIAGSEYQQVIQEFRQTARTVNSESF
jgi:hypothetical protein